MSRTGSVLIVRQGSLHIGEPGARSGEFTELITADLSSERLEYVDEAKLDHV